MKPILDLASLKEAIQQEQIIHYVYFWGHTTNKSTIGPESLSQWYPRGFDIDNIHYPTAEHYLMAQKAQLFQDEAAFKAILQTSEPKVVKQLGREVKGFDGKAWDTHKFNIAVTANKAKFSQHPDLKEFLMSTADSIIVEASPVDKIWGVGLAQDNPDILNPNHWQGENLLGFVLMKVRASFR